MNATTHAHEDLGLDRPTIRDTAPAPRPTLHESILLFTFFGIILIHELLYYKRNAITKTHSLPDRPLH